MRKRGLIDVALIPKNWIVFDWSFPLQFPGWEKERKR